ncbi:MAG: cation:proton antiporter [Bacteroidales bacterium]|nr:MAG: cation:proton antiporter [Bacteroidales bacterium]
MVCSEIIVTEYWKIIIAVTGFLIILVAARQIAGLFQKIKLPLVTGMLFMGILCGPYLLDLIPFDSSSRLSFINDISLAFIAFAAGAELYLKELRSRFKSIRWMTTWQLITTFLISSTIIFFVSGYIPFIQRMHPSGKLAVAILISTIFVARSPTTMIAVINELRAKGPFTHTALGVTVLIDVLVIILFAITFSLANTLLTGIKFNLYYLVLLGLELSVSFGLGYLAGKFLGFLLARRLNTNTKAILILMLGYGVYLFSNLIRAASTRYLSVDFYMEPLLICIIASFFVTNYTRYRREFLKIIQDTLPYVYVAFFTLVGATIHLDIIIKVWFVTLGFFLIRMITLMIGAWIGGTMGGDPFRYVKIGWMPYITQAGVSLGLVTVVAGEFTEWGAEFATLMISVIVINQIVGPPMLKWAIGMAGEDHSKAKTRHDGIRKAVIFGLEDQSLALARQLADHDWKVKIATAQHGIPDPGIENVRIVYSSDITLEKLKELGLSEVDAIVTLKTDEENLKICELTYENFGTHEMVVRLNHRFNLKKFHELGALIVEPSTAMVSLLDHFVRSPMATSLLLGMEENQDTVDLVVKNPDLHGLALRNLHLPPDILILSTTRRGHPIISTGYTRLRLGDILTIVGSVESIEQVKLRIE